MSKPTFLPSIKSGIFLSTFATLLAVAGMPLAVAQDADDEEIENIIVTGSYIKRAQSDMASPIQIIDSDMIADIGARTLPDLINTLTINTGAQIYANHLDQGRNAGTTNINLRGLGESSTLVLLNSTRNTLTPAVNRLLVEIQVVSVMPSKMAHLEYWWIRKMQRTSLRRSSNYWKIRR